MHDSTSALALEIGEEVEEAEEVEEDCNLVLAFTGLISASARLFTNRGCRLTAFRTSREPSSLERVSRVHKGTNAVHKAEEEDVNSEFNDCTAEPSPRLLRLGVVTGYDTRFFFQVWLGLQGRPVEPQHCVAMAVAFHVACEHILSAAAAEMKVHYSH